MLVDRLTLSLRININSIALWIASRKEKHSQLLYSNKSTQHDMTVQQARGRGDTTTSNGTKFKTDAAWWRHFNR